MGPMMVAAADNMIVVIDHCNLLDYICTMLAKNNTIDNIMS